MTHGAGRPPDDLPPEPPTVELRYGPPAAAPWLLGVLAVAFGVGGATSDSSGRLLAGIAVLACLATALWLAIGGPPLVADAAGVTVRGLWRRRHASWAQVRHIGVDDRRRSRALELETDVGLLEVPALLLGRTAASKARAELERLRPR